MSEHRFPLPKPDARAKRGSTLRARRPASLAVLLLAGLLAGCTERAITVSEAELEIPEQTAAALTDASAAARDVYYADDEAVTLEVEFDVNLVAVYKSFYAWWYFPNGRIYLREPVRNKFGSNRALVTSMPIRGAPPASWPGVWRVQLTLRDRTLLERTFEIRPGSRLAAQDETEAAGAVLQSAQSEPLTDPPLCPDPGSPAGTCSWEAPEEGSRGAAYLELLAPPAAAARVTESPPPTPPGPAAAGLGPAPVSARSGIVAARVPESVIEAADRARAAREEALLAARSPPPPAPPSPPEPAAERPGPETSAAASDAARDDSLEAATGDAGGTGGAEEGTDPVLDAETPERAWGAGASDPAAQAAPQTEPLGVAAADDVAPAAARPDAAAVAGCPGPCAGQAPEE